MLYNPLTSSQIIITTIQNYNNNKNSSHIMNFKVCLLLVCLLQVAFFKDTRGHRDSGLRGDRSPTASDSQCKVTCGSDSPVALWKDSPRFERNDSPLSQLQFDGSCNCELNLWSQANYGGSTVNSPFGQRNGNWNPSSLWTTGTQSWKVDCQF